MRAVYRGLAAFVAAAALSLLSIPPTVTPAAARGEVVPFSGEASPGTIVVRTNERRLYLVLGKGRALCISGRRRPRRTPVGGARRHLRQAHQAGLGAAA